MDTVNKILYNGDCDFFSEKDIWTYKRFYGMGKYKIMEGKKLPSIDFDWPEKEPAPLNSHLSKQKLIDVGDPKVQIVKEDINVPAKSW